MVLGSGRRVGGWMMATGAFLVAAGVAVLAAAADALQAQAAQLDPSQQRLEATGAQAIAGGVIAGVGLLVFLVASLAFLVGSHRVRKHGAPLERPPGIAAGVAGFVVLGMLLFALVAPQGPLAKSVQTAAGGGPGAVEVRTFEGELTAATVGGHASAEDVHSIDLVARRGAINLHLGSGGQGVGAAFAIAILEAPDGSGGWKEIARTPPGADTTASVPVASYSGNLRARVQMADGSAGSVKYVLGFSFAPATE